MGMRQYPARRALPVQTCETVGPAEYEFMSVSAYSRIAVYCVCGLDVVIYVDTRLRCVWVLVFTFYQIARRARAARAARARDGYKL